MVRSRNARYTRGWAGSGSTTRWRQVRALVLARDGYQCQIKGPRCTGVADTVDHIVALKDGGAMYDPAGLRAACLRCNAGRRDDPTTAPDPTRVEIRTVW